MHTIENEKNALFVIIPGFGESGSDKQYRELKKKIISSFGAKVLNYDPIWDRKTIKNWVADFDEKFKNYDFKILTIIGFSMGAYTALVLSSKHKFKKIILASLSPYFKENLENLPKEAINFMGKNRIKEFSNISIPKEIKSESVFLFGDQDWPIAVSQAKKLSSLYKGKFVSVENTEHELTDDYIKKITAEA